MSGISKSNLKSK